MSAEAQPSTQPPAASAGGSSGGLAGYFKFEERGTNAAIEAKAGLTTFFVMVYIIFLNAAILGAGFKLDPAGVAAVSAGTALVAGIATIVMGDRRQLPPRAGRRSRDQRASSRSR